MQLVVCDELMVKRSSVRQPAQLCLGPQSESVSSPASLVALMRLSTRHSLADNHGLVKKIKVLGYSIVYALLFAPKFCVNAV